MSVTKKEPSPPDVVKRIRRFARLKMKLDAAQAVVDDIKGEAKAMHDDLRDAMIENGIPSMPVSVDGQRISVHIKEEMWAKPVGGDRAAVIKALKVCRLGHYCAENFNSNSLSSYVRNRMKEVGSLPPSLAAVLEVTESCKVVAARTATKESVTRAAKRKAKPGTVVSAKSPKNDDFPL